MMHFVSPDSLNTMHMQKCADKAKQEGCCSHLSRQNKEILPSEITLLRFLNAPQHFSQTPCNKSSF